MQHQRHQNEYLVLMRVFRIGHALPYWIHRADDGALWFNEHTGNKIAHFLPNNNTLIEYWVPSRSKLFSQCDPESTIVCGIANALQLSVEAVM